MGTIYIQLEDRLQKVSADVTQESIENALGYTPSDFSGEFQDINNNPIEDDGVGALSFTDDKGYVIAKIDASGVKSVDFIAGEHVLSDKANATYVDAKIEEVNERITDAEDRAFSGYFKDLLDNPVDVTEEDNLSFTDDKGYVIAKIDASGVKSVDFIAGDHVLSDKVSQSEVAGLYVEHANEADHALNSDKLGNIKASEYILRKDVSTNFITKEDASLLYVDESELGVAISDVSDIINDRIDKLSISDLYESPIDDKTDDGNLYIMDASGNVVTRIDASGTHSIDFITAGGVHKLSDKVDWDDVPDLHVSHADTADDASNAKMANDSKKLGNKDASLYAIKSEVAQTYLTKTDASNTYITIEEADKYIDADELANGTVKYATDAGNAKQLGGKDASYYALKSELTATDSSIRDLIGGEIEEVNNKIDNLTISDLSGSPIDDNDKDGVLGFMDASGKVIAKIDASGVHSVDFITTGGVHVLSNKIDAADVPYVVVENAINAEESLNATNAKKLGDKEASLYALKSDVPGIKVDSASVADVAKDASLLEGHPASYFAVADNLKNYLTTKDASSTYLTKTDASNTYLGKVDASNTYLKIDTAANTYLTKDDAASTYIDDNELKKALESYSTKNDVSVYLTKVDASNTYLTKDEASSTYIDETELTNALKPYIYDASVIDKVKDASVKYATTAGNTSQLEGHSASYFAVADDLKSYLTTKDASTTYLKIKDASVYITKDDVASTYIDGDELRAELESYPTKTDVSVYLTKTDASKTYLTKTDASKFITIDDTTGYIDGDELNNALKPYLKSTDAASTYLTKTDASNVYVTKEDASKFITIDDTTDYVDGSELANALKPYVLDASLTGYKQPTDTANRNYKITKDGSTYYVNVPWEAASLSGDLEDSVNALLGSYVKKTELKDATVAHATTAGSADVANDSSKLEGYSASDFVLDTELTNVLKSYPTKTDVSVYLTKNDASSTYLTQASAESIYLTKGDASSTYIDGDDLANTLKTYVLDASLTGYTTDNNAKKYKIQKDDSTKSYYVEVPWQSASLDPDSGLVGELNAILKDASVNYANKAGDADTLDGKHANSFALDASLQDVSTMVSEKVGKDDLEPYVTKTSLTGFEEIDTDNNKNYKISENDDGTYYVHVPWESGGSGGDLTDYVKKSELADSSVKYASNSGFAENSKQLGGLIPPFYPSHAGTIDNLSDGVWDFIDETGNYTIMRVDKLGVQSVDFIAGGHILSQKANIDEYSDPNDWWAYGD